MSILEVKDLRVAFRQDGRLVEAVKGVSFAVDRGETVATSAPRAASTRVRERDTSASPPVFEKGATSGEIRAIFMPGRLPEAEGASQVRTSRRYWAACSGGTGLM